jgi:hypothetical protein
MQDCKYNLQHSAKEILTFTVHSSIHHIPMESRPHGADQAHRHLPHLCPIEELLPVLYARLVIWSPDRRP